MVSRPEKICWNAYRKALQTDPEAAFGGIIAFNGELDGRTSEEVSKLFVEVLIAPAFTEEAKSIFNRKKNLRLLQIALGKNANAFDLKRVGGGLLVQSPDIVDVIATDLKVVTKKQPTRNKCRICCSLPKLSNSSNPMPSFSVVTEWRSVSAQAK